MRAWTTFLLCVVSISSVFGQTGQQPPPTRPPAATPGQPETLSVQGRLLPPPGMHELPEATIVTILSGRNTPIRSKMPQGFSFEFGDLRPGKYYIRVESTGYRTTEVEVEVMDGPLFFTVPMGVRLEPGEPSDAPVSAETVPVDLLAVPQKARKEFEKADRASNKNDPNQAIRHLEKALKIHPDFADAYNLLAFQHLRLEAPTEARLALERAIELNPDHALAHRNMGLLHLTQKEFDQALPYLQRSASLDPGDFSTLNYLAELYYRTKDFEQARQTFERSYQVNPEYHEALLQIGNCLLALKQPIQAVEAYRSFMERVPGDKRKGQIRDLIAKLTKKD